MNKAYPTFHCERCGIFCITKHNTRKPRFCSRRCSNERRTDDFAGRLWARIDRSGGAFSCWPWLGSSDKDGYGKTHDRDRGDIRAHRAVFQLVHGWLPQVVRHSCDWPPCCNPEHLLAGSMEDNRNDMIERERQCRGERARTARLTTAAVCEARRLACEGHTGPALANRYGLSRSAMHALLTGQTWKHLPLDGRLQ